MTDESDPQQVVIHPRIPAELRVRLKAYAKATRRSMTGALVHLLESGLDASESAAPDRPRDEDR